MTSEDLEEVRQRCEAVGGYASNSMDTESLLRMNEANEAFIAHARTDIPSLLAHIEALEAERDRLREALRLAAQMVDEVNGWDLHTTAGSFYAERTGDYSGLGNPSSDDYMNALVQALEATNGR